MSTASYSSSCLDDVDDDDDIPEKLMAMMSIADHDVVDVEDDDSKGGDVNDLNGDCSAWRLSVPYHLSTLFVPLHLVASRRRSLLSIRQSNDRLQPGQSP